MTAQHKPAEQPAMRLKTAEELARAAKPAEHGRGEVGDAAVCAMTKVLQDAWAKAEPNHGVTLYPASYVASFVDMARAAIAALTQPKCEKVSAQEVKDWAERHDITGKFLMHAYEDARSGVSLPRQSEAVATIVPHPDDNTQPGVQWHRKDFPIGTKLYTTPPAQVDTTAGDGMVLVPREPTEAMVLAALAARNERIKANAESNKGKYRIGGTAPGDTMIGTYRAMIQAATAQDGMK